MGGLNLVEDQLVVCSSNPISGDEGREVYYRELRRGAATNLDSGAVGDSEGGEESEWVDVTEEQGKDEVKDEPDDEDMALM